MEGALGPRADQAHVTFEHIPELRHLVEVPAAHEFADTQQAGIFAQSGLMHVIHFAGGGSHGADLVHLERLSVSSDAFLPEEDSPWRLQTYQGSKDRDDGRGEQQADASAQDVHAALERAIDQAVQRQVGHAQHGHTADRLKVQAGEEDLEIGRDDFELDKFLLTQVGEPDDFLVRQAKIGEQDHVDFVLVQKRWQL